MICVNLSIALKIKQKKRWEKELGNLNLNKFLLCFVFVFLSFVSLLFFIFSGVGSPLLWYLEMRVRKYNREYSVQCSHYRDEEIEKWTSPPSHSKEVARLLSKFSLLTSGSAPFLTPCCPFTLGLGGVERNLDLWGTSSPFSRGGDVTLPSHAVLTCHYPGSWWPKEIQTGHTCAPGEGSTNPHWAPIPLQPGLPSPPPFLPTGLSVKACSKPRAPGDISYVNGLCSSNVVKEPQWRWDGGIGNGKSPTDASPFLSWTIHSSLGRWTF